MSTEWTRALARADVPDEDVIAVTAGGRKSRCTAWTARSTPPTTSVRTAMPGCATALMGHEIECPLHQGRFDVRDGRALCSPLRENLVTYPVRIEDGIVFVAL